MQAGGQFAPPRLAADGVDRDTDYGKLLTAKLLAFGVLIITAAFSREIVNRRFRSPRPAPSPAPPPRVPVTAGGPPLPPDAGGTNVVVAAAATTTPRKTPGRCATSGATSVSKR